MLHANNVNPGFYDWRVVVVSQDGLARPLPLVTRASAAEVATLAAAGCLPMPLQPPVAAETSVVAAIDPSSVLIFAPVEVRALAQVHFGKSGDG